MIDIHVLNLQIKMKKYSNPKNEISHEYILEKLSDLYQVIYFCKSAYFEGIPIVY